MCGIALIISGIRIGLSSVYLDSAPSAPEVEPVVVSIDDLKAALYKRGPDSLGSKKVFLHSNILNSKEKIMPFIELDDVGKSERPYLQYCGKKCDATFSENGELHEQENRLSMSKTVAELHFIGATLQLRGINQITQPLVDTSGNILIYNGEIFGGIDVPRVTSDTEILLQSLGNCCSCSSQEHRGACYSIEERKLSIPEFLSTIKGPWVLVYWQVTLCGEFKNHLVWS